MTKPGDDEYNQWKNYKQTPPKIGFIEPNDSAEKSKNEYSSFEDLLDLVGPLGKWQGIVFAFIAFLQFWTSMINLAVIFFGITPEHTCSTGVLDTNFSRWTFEQRRNITSSLDTDNVIDSCKYYPQVAQLAGQPFEQAYNNALTAKFRQNPSNCTDWQFDTTVDMTNTIVTQWNLVCDRKFYTEHSQLVYMGGFFVGALIAGFISDRFGRKVVFTIASVMTACLSLGESFSPTYVWFLLIRFFLSVVQNSAWVSGYCLCLEITTSKFRIWVGGLFWIPYAFGYTCLALVAYITKDWIIMHIVISVPVFISLIFWWVIPESPRWLIINKKFEQAENTLRTAAKRNGRDIPPNLDFQKSFNNILVAHEKESQMKENFFHLFKSKRLTLRTLNIYFNWFVNSMVYYGVSLNVSFLAGDRFINNAISGAVEIPGNLICVPLLWWGRKKGLFLMLLIAGLTLLPIPWLPTKNSWVVMLFAMTGKLCITASFTLIYVFTVELYPTVIRNTGLSTSSCVARIGSMIAPYISGVTKLGPRYFFVPMIVFGAFSLAAAMLTLFLPETLGKPMPEFFSDAKKLGKSKGIVFDSSESAKTKPNSSKINENESRF